MKKINKNHIALLLMIAFGFLPSSMKAQNEEAHQCAVNIFNRMRAWDTSSFFHEETAKHVQYVVGDDYDSVEKYHSLQPTIRQAVDELEKMPFSKRMRSEEMKDGFQTLDYMLMQRDTLNNSHNLMRMEVNPRVTRFTYQQQHRDKENEALWKIMLRSDNAINKLDKLLSTYIKRERTTSETTVYNGTYPTYLVNNFTHSSNANTSAEDFETIATIYRIPGCDANDYATWLEIFDDIHRQGADFVQTASLGMPEQTAVTLLSKERRAHVYAVQLRNNTLCLLRAMAASDIWKPDHVKVPLYWSSQPNPNSDKTLQTGKSTGIQIMDDSVFLDNQWVYAAGEKMPYFPGGEEAMIRYITQNLSHYNTSGSGRVLVKVYIDSEGRVRHPEVITGVSRQSDNAVVATLMGMPKWNPGIRNGAKTCIQITIPVRFTPPVKQ